MKNALKLLTILVSLACWTSTAHAHTKILTSKPANGTVLSLPPPQKKHHAKRYQNPAKSLHLHDGHAQLHGRHATKSLHPMYG